MEKLKNYLSKLDNPRILDIATGRGSFIGLLVHLYDGYSGIVGIDHNPKAVEAAKKGFKDTRITFQHMDACDMSFEKNSFDVACLSNSMHHIENIESVISKMTELVNPGGILLFNEMISDNKEEKQMTHTHFHHFWAEVNRANGITHNETMTRQEIMNIFADHPDIIVTASWDLQMPEMDELPKEAYDQIKGTLVSSLESVKEHQEYDKFTARAKELEELLDNVGWASATQIITIAEPQ